MSKAILVIDTPSSCGKCKLFMNNGNTCFCTITKYEATGFTKPKGCPLKPMPNKKNLNLEYIDNYSVRTTLYCERVGYNKCLDEILGGNNDR